MIFSRDECSLRLTTRISSFRCLLQTISIVQEANGISNFVTIIKTEAAQKLLRDSAGVLVSKMEMMLWYAMLRKFMFIMRS